MPAAVDMMPGRYIGHDKYKSFLIGVGDFDPGVNGNAVGKYAGQLLKSGFAAALLLGAVQKNPRSAIQMTCCPQFK